MNLTPQQQAAINKALAEREGWKMLDDGSELYWHPDSGTQLRTVELLPNYCNDLNACRRIEEGMTDEEHKRYRMMVKEYLRYPLIGQHPDKLHRAYFSASPAQRAVALCRALSINIEGVTL